MLTRSHELLPSRGLLQRWEDGMMAHTREGMWLWPPPPRPPPPRPLSQISCFCHCPESQEARPATTCCVSGFVLQYCGPLICFFHMLPAGGEMNSLRVWENWRDDGRAARFLASDPEGLYYHAALCFTDCCSVLFFLPGKSRSSVSYLPSLPIAAAFRVLRLSLHRIRPPPPPFLPGHRSRELG